MLEGVLFRKHQAMGAGTDVYSCVTDYFLQVVTYPGTFV